ncbi:MAG: hypothetical protein EBQ75_09565 [Actinobacteria bacterium]|nr:hypothetical protein [Actinomycetota bacterium]
MAVDVVALTIRHNLLQVAVVRRKGDTSCIADKVTGIVAEEPREPFDYALPSGHVNWESESLDDTARRKVFERRGSRSRPTTSSNSAPTAMSVETPGRVGP